MGAAIMPTPLLWMSTHPTAAAMVLTGLTCSLGVMLLIAAIALPAATRQENGHLLALALVGLWVGLNIAPVAISLWHPPNYQFWMGAYWSLFSLPGFSWPFTSRRRPKPPDP